LNKKEYFEKYYIKHKDKIKKDTKEYRKNNPKKRRKWQKQWSKNNPKYIKQWREDNPEKVREISNKYYKNNHERIKESAGNWQRNKRKIDLKCNLNHKISGGIYKSLRREKNGWHWETLVGYTLKDLIKRLKKTMPKGYTWQDFLEGRLHIDHRIPISAFNYTKPEHIDFKRCWALKNLQLLPAKENRVKHDKLSRPFQPALKI